MAVERYNISRGPARQVSMALLAAIIGQANATAIRRKARKSAKADLNGDPYGTRTRVFAVRGRRPRPLDEGAVQNGAAPLSGACSNVKRL